MTTADEPSVIADVMTGKFSRSFGPPSPSPASLGVTPSGPRSMPMPQLPTSELPRIELPVPAVDWMVMLFGLPALVPALAMVFASPTATPPISVLVTPDPARFRRCAQTRPQRWRRPYRSCSSG